MFCEFGLVIRRTDILLFLIVAGCATPPPEPPKPQEPVTEPVPEQSKKHVPFATVENYHDRLIAYSLGNFATYYGISVEGIKGIAPIL